jgi:hypothetical protein
MGFPYRFDDWVIVPVECLPHPYVVGRLVGYGSVGGKPKRVTVQVWLDDLPFTGLRFVRAKRRCATCGHTDPSELEPEDEQCGG